jgi:prepilin-type N-terminal cleavage/methylation domain-containing protein
MEERVPLLSTYSKIMNGQRTHLATKRLARNDRRAMTLLEVLLVMVVLVIIGSIAIINTRSAFANTRLKKGAEAVRAEFARARIRAIKSGQTQVFRHLLSSDGYVTTPQMSPDDLLESDSRHIASSFAVNDESIGGLGITNEVSRLPEDVYFMGSDVAMDARAESRMSKYEQTPTAGGSGGGQATAGGWGMPVFFFPDGSTTTARMVLANQQGYSVSIELRGLTGISRIGSLRLANEVSALGVSQ